MKSLLLFLFLSLGIFQNVNAQLIYANAIGLRSVSDDFGFGAELSHQIRLGDTRNRLELDLGFKRNNWFAPQGYRHITITGIYHWVFRVGKGTNFYAGPAAQIVLHSNVVYSGLFNSGYTVGVGGQFGIEYDFNTVDFPFQFSVDIRPMLGVLENNLGFNYRFGYGVSLGIRYTF